MRSSFERGTVVAVREVWDGRLWTARPMRVVEDSPGLIALYLATGTRWKRAAGRDGIPRRLPTPGWVLMDDEWRVTRVLYLVRPGATHAVHAFWNGDGRFTTWYVNLQTPLVRTRLGFDFMDAVLDLVISPDRTTWQWKDEAELQEAVQLDIFSASFAEAVRVEGEAVLRDALAGEGVFGGAWQNWTPDAGWAVPDLPDGWDEEPARL